jgi:hypothetical protein
LPGLEATLCKAYEDEVVSHYLHEDPYGLFAIAMAQWHIWSVDLFYTLEEKVNGIEALNEGDAPPGFRDLHSISTRIIQFMDVFETGKEFRSSLLERHKVLSREETQKDSFCYVETTIGYYNNAYLGTYHRMKNLEKRISNQIQLVGQDSPILWTVNQMSN